MIPDPQLPVLVAWKHQKELDAIFKKKYMSKDDWLFIQRHSLTLWEHTVNECLLDGRITKIMQGKEELLLWTGHYDAKFGLLFLEGYQGPMIF